MAGKKVPGPLFVLRGHNGEVQALAFHPHLELLYSGDAEGEVFVWDLCSRRQIQNRRLHPPAAGILSLALTTHDGVDLLLSQGRDGTITAWTLDAGGLISRDPLKLLEVGSHNFCRMSVVSEAEGPENRVIVASCAADPTKIAIWSLLEDRCLTELVQPEPPQWGMCMALSLGKGDESGRMLRCLAGYEDGTVALWELDANEGLLKLNTLKPHSESIMAVAFDSLLQGGVTGAADPIVALVNTSSELKITCTCDLPHAGVADVAIRADSRVFVLAGWDGKVRAFRYGSSVGAKHGRLAKKAPGSFIAMLDYHYAGVNAVQFRQKDSWLATGSKDKTIGVWTMFETSSGVDT